ncbi:pulmonary surfactant-associated protein D-like protein, partial [Aphelenchoides avenae]
NRDATDCAESGIPSACQIYIGLRRCSLTCSEFSWPDTTPFGPGFYENWADGEPTIEGGQLACAEMLDNGEWNDLTCDSQRLFVCEKPANGAEPAPQPN